MKRLMIIGSGGHGKVIANIAKDSAVWDEIVFLDDKKKGESVAGFDVVDKILNYDKYIDSYKFIVGIGNAIKRKKITKKLLDSKVELATIIHPSTILGIESSIGAGSVIMPGCIIGTSVLIGDSCIINSGTIIEHDCVLQDFVHLSPGVVLSGTVMISEGTWLGTGTKVINNVSISNDIIVGAGSVVINSLDESGTYFGVPAKKRVNKLNL